jgi:hypothetical protein
MKKRNGMSIRDVAERVEKNTATVGRWILRGWNPGRGADFIRLNATRNGKHWTITEADLLAFQEACKAASIIEDMPEPKRKQRRGKERSRAERIAAAEKQLKALGY